MSAKRTALLALGNGQGISIAEAENLNSEISKLFTFELPSKLE